MDCEELQALEAALAFFDDCDGITKLSSGHSSDDSSSSVHDVSIADAAVKPSHNEKKCRRRQLSADAQEFARVKAKLEVPGRNRSRDLQKLELLQLRVEAATLQDQVEELDQGDNSGNNFSALLAEDVHTSLIRQATQMRLGAWQGLAKKQKKLRKEAETENVHLRGLIEAQLKTIKTLQRLFQKQVVAKQSPCLTRWFNVNVIPSSPSDEMVVLNQLSNSLSKLYGNTDRVLQLNGLETIRSPFLQTNTQPLSPSKTRIEFLKCDILPFDYRAVAKALMDKMASSYEGEEDKHIPPALRKCVVARATTLELEERVKIQYRFTGIKYAEHKREVIVLSGQNELLEVFGVAVDGIRYHENTWCVLSEVSSGVCLLQLCIGATLEAKQVLETRREFVAKVCELVAHLAQEMFGSVLKEIEHNLLKAK
ncbi:hypothetical protein V7S43_003828 [Phytophthora oleae]|uniref:Uncharacterized protein n=1 Tax=Phytophthora oleae TaxID=2107226 RepID=A0ABD3FWE9_9STRA